MTIFLFEPYFFLHSCAQRQLFLCLDELLPYSVIFRIALRLSLAQLNKWLQLEPFPDASFRNTVMVVLVLNIAAAFLWDRLMLLLFAPKVLWASIEGTGGQDVVNGLKVVAICSAVIYFLSTVRRCRDFIYYFEHTWGVMIEAKAFPFFTP